MHERFLSSFVGCQEAKYLQLL